MRNEPKGTVKGAKKTENQLHNENQNYLFVHEVRKLAYLGTSFGGIEHYFSFMSGICYHTQNKMSVAKTTTSEDKI